MANFIKTLLCKKHEYELVENIYGDRINIVNARAFCKCRHCGKIVKAGLYGNGVLDPKIVEHNKKYNIGDPVYRIDLNI